MHFFTVKPKIFKKFPRVRTFFVIGKLEPSLKALRKKNVLASMKQVHGNKSAYVANIPSPGMERERPARHWSEPQAMAGGERSKLHFNTDALFTDQSNLFLTVRSADCLPIMFFCPKVGVVGAVHAGWKGTHKQILKKTARLVARKFHASLRDFYFFFGPAARPCCYEIPPGDHRLKIFSKHFLVKRNGKMFLDFFSDNQRQLLESGVPKGHIEDSGICTIHNHRFPSHRREGAKRQASLLSLIGLR